ncbi:probable tRNA (uracil-O(2)-)-methyltransferase [Dendroctonus ponderosae]
MFQVPLVTSSTIIPLEKYWDALLLYYSRPHLVNRKITAVSQGLLCKVQFNSKGIELPELLNRSAILYELRKKNSWDHIDQELLKSLLEPYDKNVQLTDVSIQELRDYSQEVFVSIRLLFPRLKNCLKALEVITFDKQHNTAVFLAVSDTDKSLVAPPFAYQIQLASTSNLRINVNSFENADTGHAEWLASKLFSKLLKWIEDSNAHKPCIQSLSLIRPEDYCSTYNRLKETYAEKLVQEWPKKAGTDPQKYVFEDIAITSYLICLWKEEAHVNFVDCGCGNGLLVFLLNQEGFEGFGIDIRRRAIWDIYPESVNLQVGAVNPNSLFPSCTWIIGNHSDELTPWIPIIALKSSPRTNYFVLPCCPYDFNGLKFIRKNTSVSTYADYLTYIEEISRKCEFQTNIDKLRIPSTKRTCLIGKRKTLTEEEQKSLVIEISAFVDQKISEKFVQRSAIEKVRNCTQLDRNLISGIVEICMNQLLSSQQHMEKSNGDLWNKGVGVAIPDLVQRIPKDVLRQLKQECGGLQTLLRNHRYLFEISNSIVRIRLPPCFETTSKYKAKPCWFSRNHPNGCLHEAEVCAYRH